MVRRINVAFDDDKFKKLEKAKSNRTWEDFILTLVEGDDKQKKSQERK